jgi:hypothetical protein
MDTIEPNITIEIGGRRRRLRLRHRDLATAEMRLAAEGHPLSLVGPGSAPFWFSNQGGHQAGVLLMAGLLHEAPDLTLDAARDLITFDNADYVDEVLAAAVDGYLRPFLESQVKRIAKAIEKTQSNETTSGPTSPPSPGSTSESASTNSGASPPVNSEHSASAGTSGDTSGN